MSLIVQKFGGTSVANTERLKNVADIVTKTAQAGNQVVVVVSAQGDTTDDLIVKAAELNDRPSKREMDVLLNTGEMISMSLLAMAIQKLGFPVVSLTGWQIGLETNSNYSDARIKRIIIRHDGFKVFPSMIENVISRHPAVHQCCVVGCADTDHTQGRLPFVFVVLEPAATGKKRQILRELRQLCLEELPEYVQPAASAYKIIPEMPLTPAGKADYRKLEEEVG